MLAGPILGKWQHQVQSYYCLWLVNDGFCERLDTMCIVSDGCVGL